MRGSIQIGSRAFVASVVVRLTSAGLLAGVLAGGLVVSSSAKELTATAPCESNRCENGTKCVYHEANTECDAIGKAACVTFPCDRAAKVAIRGWLTFEDAESSDSLVSMGSSAVSAVLGYAGLPEYRHRPMALNVLEKMHERWGADAFTREDMRRLNALAFHYLGSAPYVARDERVSVMIAAIDLALELGGRRLRATIQELASNPDEVVLRLGEGLDHMRVVEHARARLTPP